MSKPYISLPVINGNADGPAPFQWDSWYKSIDGRSIAIPEVDAIAERIYTDQYKRFEGDVTPRESPDLDPAAAAVKIKGLAKDHGADIVGIAMVEPDDIYRGQTVNERYAVVVGSHMSYDSFVDVPSTDAAIECMRIYETLGEVVISLANDIRGLGYQCTVEHPVGDSRVMHVPLALKAGFGELGRHGSIIHPEFGPLFRIGSVLTSMPLETDSPIDVGIGAFCDRCQACRIFCPADAIPDERSPDAGKDPQGYDRYQIDTGKCFPYFAKHNYCSACLAVCAYNHKKWALTVNNEVGPFPTVPFGTIPDPSDPDIEKVHDYPRLRRDEPSPFHRKPKKSTG